MVPSRRTQPFRKGPRAPSIVLTNMKRGRTVFGHNPMDAKRRKKRRLRVKPRRRRL
jgi:hypothetical protein